MERNVVHTTGCQALLFLYENPANGKAKPTSIVGAMVKTPLTGVDASTSFTLGFGHGHLQAQAILVRELPPRCGFG
jgi:hypothetical protein